jgi:hypothetical protein
MSSKTTDVFPPMIPAIRDVRFIEGETELSSDVRLATSNVLPFMRKTMRSVFSSAGIRVVANKKRFVINVNVVETDELDFTGVPEELREDYYEVDIIDNEVTVRTGSQQGAIWGSQTFAHIYKGLGNNAVIPNCRVRDWAHATVRGVFFETCWGMESMGPEDWGAVMDRLIRSKLNTFGLTLVGSVCRPDVPGLVQIALPNIEGFEELNCPVTLRYFSPQKRKWIEEPTLPRIYEMDTVGNVFSLAREKGLKPVIGLNLPGFSRMVAGDADILSVNDDKLKEKLQILLDYAADKCMHKRNPYFLLSLDGFVSDKEQKAFASSTKDVAKMLEWLLPNLAERGLGRLALWADNFDGDGAVGAMVDLEKMAGGGNAEKLVVGVRNGSCESVAKLESAGVEVWNVARTCTSSWSHYETCHDAVKEIGEEGREHPEYPQIADAMYDPAWIEHGQLLSCYTWNPDSSADMDGLLEQAIQARFHDFADDFSTAQEKLKQAIGDSENSVLGLCFNRTDDAMSARNYPESAIEALKKSSNAVSELESAKKLAGEAKDIFIGISDKPKEELNDFMAKAAGSLAGEAARVEALAGCFSVLLDGGAKSKARKALVAGMKVMEKQKPRFLVPAALANLSPLLQYLDA